MRRALERLAWRLAGFKGHRVRRTSRIKSFPNPIELNPHHAGSIAILSPHLDDEAIAMGGTICNFLREKCNVHVIYITKGDVGGVPAQRRKEAERFGRLCLDKFGSAPKQYFLDNGELAVNLGRTIKEVADIMAAIKPKMVFAPCVYDNHKDHVDTYQVLLSLREKLEDTICLGYELWSTVLHPEAVMDITDYVGLKEEMIEVYESQCSKKDYASIILALNKYRGGVFVGNNRYAEAFERI